MMIIFLNFLCYLLDIRTSVVGKLDLRHGADDDDFHIQILEKSDEKVNNTMKAGKNKLKKKIVKF